MTIRSSPAEPSPPRLNDATIEEAANGTHRQARAALRELLTACSIDRVVTVDDSNRQDSENKVDRALILAALRNGQISIEQLLETETTRALAMDAAGDPRDIEDLITDVETDSPRLSDDDLEELTNSARLLGKAHLPPSGSDNPLPEALTEVPQPPDGKPPITTDLESLTTLEDLFVDVTYEALTLHQWRERQENLLKEPSPVLVLFDRDFRLEGASEIEGDRLIGDILRQRASHVFCGMVTHSAGTPERESQIAAEIVGTLDLDPAELIVIARNDVRHAPLDLVRKIRTAILARDLIKLRNLTITAFAEANKKGGAALAGSDAYTLLALVEAAAAEGTHDAHNLVRVVTSHARRELQARLHHDDIALGPLGRLRAVRGTSPADVNFHPSSDLDYRRHLDSFDDAGYLSAWNLPLEPGDIFRAVDPVKLLTNVVVEQRTRCILLTQHCDTVMRPTGTRTGNPKMLSVAPLEWITDAKKKEGKLRTSDFKLDWFEPGRPGGDWYVRLAERMQVPTLYLDACVLDRDGNGRIVVGSTPASALTPGWRLRHGQLQDWADKKFNQLAVLNPDGTLRSDVLQQVVFSLMGTGELHSIKSAVDPPNKVIAFGVRRVARLSDPRTRALLTEATQHLGRAAEEGALLQEPMVAEAYRAATP